MYTHLRNKVFEGLHDTRTFALLVVWEDACDDHDSSEYNTQVQLLKRREHYIVWEISYKVQ